MSAITETSSTFTVSVS